MLIPVQQYASTLLGKEELKQFIQSCQQALIYKNNEESERLLDEIEVKLLLVNKLR